MCFSEKQVDNNQPGCGRSTTANFGFENQCFRNVPHKQPQYTSLDKTQHVLVELCLSLWTDSMSLHACPKPPRWQSMPASDTRWHRNVVIYNGSEESVWCQLGLGNWLASQSPNQVDKGQVAPASRQAVKNLTRNLAKCVALPIITLQIQWVWLVLCNLCQQGAQLDNSWVQYIPTSPN